MNILFLLKALDMGGLEIVSSVLAGRFAKGGHNVSVFSFMKGEGTVLKRFDKDVKIIIGAGFRDCDENVKLLRSVMIEQHTDAVINQWGLPYIPIKVLNKARRGLSVKAVSVYHNDPMSNGRIQNVAIRIGKTDNSILRAILRVQLWAYREITARSMRYTYNHSDHFMVLSPSFINNFKQFTGVKDVSRLLVQTNPVTISNDGFAYNPDLKQKEIIYVGRIDNTQKRVDRVVDVWAQLENKYHDWRLTIVGNGGDIENLKSRAMKYGLERVSFEGFQNPIEYYKRASILLLTSDFEGFPLVLAEAMQAGVIPIVYGSYSAVYDIIDDGKDGMILKPDDKGFNLAKMTCLTELLLSDDALRNRMALAAIEKSKKFSLDIIYRQWMNILNGII